MIGHEALTDDHDDYLEAEGVGDALLTYADVAEGDSKGLVPGYQEIRRMVLRCFAKGGELTNKDVIAWIRDSGEISDEGLKVRAKSRPLYESRVRWAVWKLYKVDHLLDSVSPGVYSLSDDGVEECKKRGYLRSQYGKREFLRDVYMSEERYERLVGVLENRKNLILQGAPGVGKTFCARRLAWAVMGERDDSRIEMVQFHQSYGYEDFMMGYKPQGEGFVLREGVFYRFCRRAEEDPAGRPYFFIIDEINRGNLSKIFGEVMMLIERDHRGDVLKLAYRDEEFSVPENLYVIGMMNTADRSIALIDYALRRRFAFFDMPPAFGTEGFRSYQESLASEPLNRLIDKVVELNAEIASDPTLGKGFRIGHSHLCGRKGAPVDWLRAVVDFDIIPMLEEYWFDDEDRVRNWEAELHGAIQ